MAIDYMSNDIDVDIMQKQIPFVIIFYNSQPYMIFTFCAILWKT